MAAGFESLTGRNNYFEDFTVGLAIRHARGKTVTPLENVLITNMVMNTAHSHFNEHFTSGPPYNGILSFGGVNFSLVLGLAAQDCCENALAEVAVDSIRLHKPVRHGDTLYAYSEVLERTDGDRPDAGLVLFRHHGFNQKDELVAVIERRVLMKRRSHWTAAAQPGNAAS
jgi:acyl dehydratase